MIARSGYSEAQRAYHHPKSTLCLKAVFVAPRNSKHKAQAETFLYYHHAKYMYHFQLTACLYMQICSQL